mmetsp:Transcript_14421/g.30274  ORF Transcript_14421/g.30274 Transcript_14421/m.30274 type:complete len:320 (-) Transcript_14421:344-1303(-)
MEKKNDESKSDESKASDRKSVDAQQKENKKSNGVVVAHKRVLSSLPYDSIVRISGELLNSRTDCGDFGLDPVWLTHYHQLIHYKSQFGTVNVPKRDKIYSPLAEWCNEQRELYRKKKLSEVLIQKLNKIEFQLEKASGQVLSGDGLWNFRFNQLLQYKRETGTCNVPQIYTKNSSLGNWVSTQRVLYRNGKMPDERKERLNGIGFEWTRDKSKCAQLIDGVMINNFDELWEHRFQQLVAYKEAKGDCCVPQFYPANTSLGIWVDAQRVRQRNGKLSQERIDRLNTVGFTWSVKKKNETSPGECNDKNQKMQSDDDSLKS